MPKTVKALEIVRTEIPCTKIDRKMHAADKVHNSKICVKTCQRGYSPMMSNKSK